MVAIARAIDISARVLILDEPTSSLDATRCEQLFAVLDAAARAGHGDPVRHAFSRPGLRDLAIASRCCATEASSASIDAAELDQTALIAAMVGREIAGAARGARRRDAGASAGEAAPSLQATGTRAPRPACSRRDIELRPRRDRSASRDCWARAARSSRACCSASIARTRGEICDERRRRCRSTIPADAIAQGLALLPRGAQDRRHHRGSVGARKHRADAAGARWACGGACRRREQQRADGPAASTMLGHQDAAISTSPIGSSRAATSRSAARALRWRPSRALLILDEPTRGIDVAGKQEIMNEIVAARARGHGGAVHLRGDRRAAARVRRASSCMRDRRKVGKLPGGCQRRRGVRR